MAHNNIKIVPGELSIVLADDANVLAHHACQVAKLLALRGMGVQLLNCGMFSRRFMRVARAEVGDNLDTFSRDGKLCLENMIRGNLYGDHSYLQNQRATHKTKVLIVYGWEWSSKSWRLKEDLIFHLRETAEVENIAIIIYSQARTSPKVGYYDRGGVGKLASLALSIDRIELDREEKQTPAPEIYKPETISDIIAEVKNAQLKEAPEPELSVEEYFKRAQLSDNEINDLDSAREEVDDYEEELEFA